MVVRVAVATGGAVLVRVDVAAGEVGVEVLVMPGTGVFVEVLVGIAVEVFVGVAVLAGVVGVEVAPQPPLGRPAMVTV